MPDDGLLGFPIVVRTNKMLLDCLFGNFAHQSYFHIKKKQDRPPSHRQSATAMTELLNHNKVKQIGGGFAQWPSGAGADDASGEKVVRKLGDRQ